MEVINLARGGSCRVETEATTWVIDGVTYTNYANVDIVDATTAEDELANQTRLNWTINLRTGTGSKWMYLHGLHVAIGNNILYSNSEGSILGEWTKYNGVWVKERPFTSGTLIIPHNTNGSVDNQTVYLKVLFRYGSWAWDNDNYYRESEDTQISLTPIARYFTNTPSISLKNRTTTSLTFNWNTSETCNKIVMHVGTKETTFAVNAVSGSIKVNGLAANTTYYCYWSFYRADSGLPTDSGRISLKTWANPGQSLSTKTETSITMHWSSGEDTTKNIQYSINNGSSWTNVGAVNAKNGYYTISGLNPNTTYDIKTRITREDGSTADTSALSIQTYAYPTHSKYSVGETTATLYWGCSGGVQETVEYSLDNGLTWKKGQKIDYTYAYTISDLARGTSYNILTRATRYDGSKGITPTALTITTWKAPSFTLSKGLDETSLKVNWNGNGASILSIYYSLDGGATWSSSIAALSQTSGSFNITGLKANTTYTVYLKMTRTDTSTSSVVTSDPVTTYPYPSCVGGTNIKIGDPLTLTFNNPLNREITAYILARHNTQIVLGEWTGTGTSITGFNDAITTANMYQSIPNSLSGNYVITLKYNGSIVQKEFDVNKTYSVRGDSSDSPLFSTYTYRDAMYDTSATSGIKQKITSLTGSNLKIIKGFSTLHVEIASGQKAIAQQKATIASYSLINATTETIPESVGNTIIFSEIPNINNNSWSVRATDSRGLFTTVRSLVSNSNYIDYSKPSIINFSTSRTNNNIGVNVQLKASGTFWNGNFGQVNNKDRLKAYYSYKKNEVGATWSKITSVNITSEGNTYNINEVLADIFELGSTYDFRIYIADALCDDTSTTSGALSASFVKSEVTNGTPALAIWGDKVSIGDAWDTSDTINRLRVNGGAYINGDLRVAGKINNMPERYYFNIHQSWYCFGQFNMFQNGQYAIIKVYSGGGYNGVVSQQLRFDINIRTSNGTAPYFAAHVDNFSWSNEAPTIYLKTLDSSTCEIWMAPYSYSGASFFTVETSNYTTFEFRGTAATTQPSDLGEVAKKNYFTTAGGTISGDVTITGVLAANTSVVNATDTWIPVIKEGKFQHTERRFATSVTHTNYGTNGGHLATMDFLSYWNGAHNSSGNSNLTYCNRGAFGTIVTKNSGDYLPITGGVVVGWTTVTYDNPHDPTWDYGKSNLEIRTTNGSTPSICLHKSGYCHAVITCDITGQIKVGDLGSTAQPVLTDGNKHLYTTNVFIQSAQPTAIRTGDIWFKV